MYNIIYSCVYGSFNSLTRVIDYVYYIVAFMFFFVVVDKIKILFNWRGSYYD